MNSKLLAPVALISLGLLIKTERMQTGPAGTQETLSLPTSRFQSVDFSEYSLETPSQSRNQMSKPLLTAWENMDSSLYVIPVSGPTVNSPSLESLLQTEWSMNYPSAGEWYGSGTPNFLNEERKQIGYRLIKLIKNGWVAQEGSDIEILGIFYALRYAENANVVMLRDMIDAAYDLAVKRDYWWR